MNPLIEQQLNKVRGVMMPEYDANTSTLNIPIKSNDAPITLMQDECYIVSVDDYIINPPDGFTLHTNWNGNKIPKHKYMKIDVTKIMGKMVKVNSIGYDVENKTNINEMWEGWLPESSITVIERL
jgi:hypothetical protein